MFDFPPQTSTTSGYVQQVRKVNSFLAQQDDFTPRNVEANTILTRFVLATMKTRPFCEVSAILRTPEIDAVKAELRRTLAKFEGGMEKFVAAATTGDIKQVPPGYTYGDFLYRENYNELVGDEIRAFNRAGTPRIDAAKGESIAVPGAGPAPFSAIILHLRTGQPVTCIDNDAEACERGARLVRHLAANEPGHASLATAVQFVRADAQAYDYSRHPVVHVASLIDNKDETLRQIAATAQKPTTVLVRSTEGLGALLYEPYEAPRAPAAQQGANRYAALKTSQPIACELTLGDNFTATGSADRLALTRVAATRATPKTINTGVIYTLAPGQIQRRTATASGRSLIL